MTGGPTPVPIDNIRRLTNRFTGRLGACIAEELYLRGGKVKLIHGQSSYTLLLAIFPTKLLLPMMNI